MDDKGLGNIIFYVILALIGLAGSFKGKKKKTADQGSPKKTFTWPDLSGDVTHSFPDVFTDDEEPARAPVNTVERQDEVKAPSKQGASFQKQEPVTKVKYNDGEFEETMAGQFAGEGSYRDTLAESFSGEGSISDDYADRFREEGMMQNILARQFSGEGASAMNEVQIKAFTDNAISENEISSVPEYDYENPDTGDEQNVRFNLRRAVIYSSLLERKEYSY